MIYLVRHAKAGDRSAWTGDDRVRPLTDAGRRQALALVDTLRDARFTRIAASPYVRCLETVVPLAGHHLVAIEPHDALSEGATATDTLKLVAECAPTGAVLCSHGDVIPNLLGHLAATTGLDLGSEPRCAKGSVWTLTTAPDGSVTSATYTAAS